MRLSGLIRLSASLALLGCALQALAQPAPTWRQLDPQNLVYMTLDEGTVVIELNRRFAPKTAEQFTRLVKNDFYRGLSFYRVIDGFVAQGGDESDINSANGEPALKAEFESRWDKDWPWMPVQAPDMFAAETGFVDGFAAARERKRSWLTHCPGVVAMARGDGKNSGSTDFYIVIGQAPRYLDRNLTIFGRVVLGMDVVQRIRRGRTDENGIIEEDTRRTRIVRMLMGDDLQALAVDVETSPDLMFVMDTHNEGFAALLEARRQRNQAFFHKQPAQVLDVCQVPIATRSERPHEFSPPVDP